METIEYVTRTELVAALVRFRADEDILTVDVIDNGRTLRLTRAWHGDSDAPSPAPESLAEPAEGSVLGDPMPDAPEPVQEAPAAEAEDLIGEAPKPAAPKPAQKGGRR